MASKVNTKFLTFLVLAVFVASVLIGGLYMLNVRGNTKRNMRLGEEAIAAGDFRKARDYIGRAVYKEPGNMQYLAKLEEVTRQIRPRTSTEAGELYGAWMSLLYHGARHDSTNPDRHLRLLRELLNTARKIESQWGAVIEPAEDMWRRLPESEPKRYLAKVYRSMAIFNRVKITTLEEIAEAEQEMVDTIEHLSTDDFAWATLIRGHLAMAEKLRELGRTGDIIDEQIQRVRDAIDRALKAVPDGPEVAHARLLALAKQMTMKPDSVSAEQLNEAAAHLERALRTHEVETGLLGDAVILLATTTVDGAANARDIVQQYLDKDPQALDKWLALATLSYMSDQLDRAEEAANRVIDSEQMPVGLLSRLQPELKRRACSVLVDIEGKRSYLAKDEDAQAKHIERMEAARERLAAFVGESDTDMFLLRADAKIAYTKGDFARAVMHYERLVNETSLAEDVETLFFDAVCLEKVNQIGLAHDRVTSALERRPNDPTLLKFKARIELAMGRRPEARATLEKLSSAERETEEVRLLLDTINRDPTTGISVEGKDPISVAIAGADSSARRGDLDSARRMLTSALEQAPENLQLLYALIALEVQAGNEPVAREYLQRALKVDPNNMVFRQWESVLKHDDPVDAIREFHITAISDERERAIMLVRAMKTLSLRHRALAQGQSQAGNAEAAAKSEAIANKANEEARQWAQKAAQLAPDDPRLLEYYFDEALTARNWSQAEQIIDRARAVDADQVKGQFFKGRLELAQAEANLRDGKASDARQFYQQAARTLEGVTERLGYHANAWKALAIAYTAIGNYAQAERAYEQAYKCNPNDLDTVRAYLDALVRRGDETRCLRVVRDAFRLAPTDESVRHLWLKFEAQFGDRPMALRIRRRLAQEYPNDYLNAAELVQMLSSIEPDRMMITDASGQMLYPDARWTRMSAEERAAAIERVRRDWHREADVLLERLKNRMTDQLRFAVLQAHALRSRGEVAAGEQVLKKYIADLGPQGASLESLLELGRYQMRVSHYDDALATFTKAVALQDPQTRAADRELAQLYMILTMYDKAVEHLNQIIAVSTDRAYRNQLVECLLKSNRFDEAESQLREIVKADGEDYMTLMLSASIADGRGDELLKAGDVAGAERKFATQRELLTRAQTLDPQSIMPRMLLAQSLVKEYRRTKRGTALNDALRVLDEADKVQAGTAEIGMARVAVFKEMGDTTAAANELRRVVERFPDNHVARRDLVQLLLNLRQGDAAISVVEQGIRSNPTLSVWYEAAGDLLKAIRGDAQTALAAYTKAYELGPTPMLLLKITEVIVATPRPDCRSLVARYEARPAGELEDNPVMREGYARALQCAGRAAEAREQLRIAYAKRKQMIAGKNMQPLEMGYWFQSVMATFVGQTPGTVDASAAEQFVLELCGNSPDVLELRGLARLWLNAGDPTLARTIEYQLRAVKAVEPSDKNAQVEVHDELAKYYFAAGQFNDAANAYEALLQLDPDRVEALNNFAYITAVSLHDPKKAIPYAERAVKLEPNRATIIDTLGWVHYLAGNLDQAKQYLDESLRVAPSAAAHAHMAAVLLDMQDLSGARLSLDEASRLNPDMDTQKEIDRVAEKLRQARESSR